MKLRNFLYLNTKIVEDYISSIDGCTYDEESQAITTSSEKTVSGKGGGVLISGNGAHTGKQEEEVKRSVKIRPCLKNKSCTSGRDYVNCLYGNETI